MSPHSIVFVIVLVLSILLVVWVDRLLRPGLRGLLEQIVALPAATEFYLRAFATVIVFVALAAVLGTHPDLKDGARFMEYVWAIAARLQDVFQNLLVVLLVYVGLITVLMAALRRKQ
ncbi:MAG: hypothetical protein LAO56_00925 [Acidobacteriia bacterium]|jgi:hypothetical protein|nr:hypothetical protein [Terriglobia bacterium]